MHFITFLTSIIFPSITFFLHIQGQKKRICIQIHVMDLIISFELVSCDITTVCISLLTHK